MPPVQIESHVGPDGVLTLRVPMGRDQANALVRVTVTVETAPSGAANTGAANADWHRFVDDTYGSCAGLGLERQPQGDFEQRDVIE